MNTGRFVKSTGGAARVSAEFIDLGGAIDVVDGTLEFTTELNIDSGGTLAGRGTLVGNVINTNGIVSPGSSPGRLSIEGNYTQLAGGLLFIEVGGNSAGDDFDRLTVSGTVDLAGVLQVERLGDFVPDAEDRFAVLGFDSRIGEFDSVNSDSIDEVIANFLDELLELQFS